MPRLREASLVLVIVGASLFAARPAQAHRLETDDILGAEAGTELGYGLAPFAPDHPNPYGVGIGGHAGITLFHLYMGPSFRYFFGGGGTLQLAGEVGYDVKWSVFTVRPYAAFGATMYLDAKTSPLTIAPAVQFHVEVSRPFFVGVDVRYNVIERSSKSDPATELTAMVTSGIAF